MATITAEEAIQRKYGILKNELDERARRIWAATEASCLGRGGIAMVSRATSIAISTIRIGQKEIGQNLSNTMSQPDRRVRRPGAGRKSITLTDSQILDALDALVEPSARGDPMSPLRWTCKSTRRLAVELCQQGHRVSHTKVAQLLEQMQYRLQGTRKSQEDSEHPDRDEQFEYIYQKVANFQSQSQPVISVDTKKKELLGPFANKGREYQPSGCPEKVRVHDFMDKELGKAIPYGVYDLAANTGWVSVGVDRDTAQFAVETIFRWWEKMGRETYPSATHLLITADGGGSNASRSRLWKLELQGLADKTGLEVSVSHFPPGTSKWNKIEHRMFCHITQNWRGRPLLSHEVIVQLIAATSTKRGLRIQAQLDNGIYPSGIKVSNAELKSVNLTPDDFHGRDWNYTISPRPKQ